MLSFRLKKQTSNSLADTTFKFVREKWFDGLLKDFLDSYTVNNLLRNFALIIIALQRFGFIKLFWFALIYFFLTGVCSLKI